MPVISPKRLGLILALGVVATTSAYVSAAPSGRAGAAAPTVDLSGGITPVPAIEAGQSAGFAILRRDQLPGDRVPASEADLVGDASVTGLSRSIRTPTGPGWIIPARGVICISAPDPVDGYGVGCTETAYAIKHGTWLLMTDPGSADRMLLTALLPDGADLVVSNGSKHSRIAADDNGVVATALSRGTAFTIQTSSAATTVELPADPDSVPALTTAAPPESR